MPVVTGIKTIRELADSDDFRADVIEKVGDLSGADLAPHLLLTAIWIRPGKSKGGIIYTDDTILEDKYQGKVGLVLRTGSHAFKDTDDFTFEGWKAHLGDWVVSRIGDGWEMMVNDVSCRVISDRSVKMRVSRPEIIF